MKQELLGRIVIYRMSNDGLARVAALDLDHKNTVERGDRLPMLITKDWGNGSVNGRLFLDGEGTLWMTSVKEGHRDGEFLRSIGHGDRESIPNKNTGDQ